jgi:hypothetical protein
MSDAYGDTSGRKQGVGETGYQFNMHHQIRYLDLSTQTPVCPEVKEDISAMDGMDVVQPLPHQVESESSIIGQENYTSSLHNCQQSLTPQSDIRSLRQPLSPSAVYFGYKVNLFPSSPCSAYNAADELYSEYVNGLDLWEWWTSS